MLRSMFQVYVVGSDKAIEFYQRAFNAKLLCAYPNDDGTLMHSELDVYGQVLAVSEANTNKPVTGNTMQFCLHLGEGQAAEVYRIYEVLKEGAASHEPVGDSGYSKHCFSLVDKFGVSWCVFE
jgi:PhnB protein